MIETRYYGVNISKPLDITQDSYGVIFEIGSKVVYNLSGGLEFGHIDSIVKNEWKYDVRSKCWRLYFEIAIKNIINSKISKIKNPNSFLILETK